MRATTLDLGIAPLRVLAAGVLKQNDLVRRARERLGRSVSVKGELHPLPVAFMQIVEVVEVVEEPILQRESSTPWFARDVGICHRRRAAGTSQRSEIAGVSTARLQWVTGQI